jgi:hypothetical protein
VSSSRCDTRGNPSLRCERLSGLLTLIPDIETTGRRSPLLNRRWYVAETDSSIGEGSRNRQPRPGGTDYSGEYADRHPAGRRTGCRRAPQFALWLEIVRQYLGRHEIAVMQTAPLDEAAGCMRRTTMLAHASGSPTPPPVHTGEYWRGAGGWP